jgi:hypothetical protein
MPCIESVRVKLRQYFRRFEEVMIDDLHDPYISMLSGGVAQGGNT